MHLHEKKIGDIVTFQRGFDITHAQRKEGSIPIVSSSGITGYHSEHKVDRAGVVIGRKGTLGTVHYIDQPHWPHDTTLWIKDFQGNDPKFIYYFLKLLGLESFDVGAANPTLNRNHVHKITVRIPSPLIQNKIAAILTTYDDLIESNNSRIQLLENMAEEIYKEWFVRLRFPGFEMVKVVKGLPSGWRVKSLDDLGSYLNGYAFKPIDWKENGMPIIKIKEMTSGVTSNTPRNNGEKINSKFLVLDGDIVFSWSATFLVKIWSDGQGLLNQHLFKVTPNIGISREFLYHSIDSSLVIFDMLATGVTMKHIKRKELSFVKVNVPPPNVMDLFTGHVAPLSEECLVLKKANKILVETRDKLLPRLISGKLSVENLNIKFPPSMEEALA